VNAQQYASMPISLPEIDEQREIANVFSDMDAEIAALEAKLAKTRDVKQGMMQVLLTGEVRLI
jgi:type I restriction enzyme, S subunit